MAAFLASVLSLIIPAVRTHVFRRVFSLRASGIPRPAVPHMVLTEETMCRFDEVVVIGDVHGCLDELKELFQKIHDSAKGPSCVLKVFVGDLVNKGPLSRQVIHFLLQEQNRETCVSVRGNHDDVVVDQVLNVVRKEPLNLRPKNKWMEEVREEELRFLMDLPYTITIPSLNAIIVHAGLIPGVPMEEMTATDMVSMRNLVQEGGTVRATRSHKEGTAWAKCWTGPAHVYFGHDAKRQLQREAHATGLDTGCVYGKELSGVFIKGPRNGEFISVKAKKVYQEVSDGD